MLLHRRDAQQAVGDVTPIATDGAAEAIELDSLIFPATSPTMLWELRVALD